MTLSLRSLWIIGGLLAIAFVIALLVVYGGGGGGGY
jgi:hypothetical protein